jgi:hypothetical protein
MGEFLVGAYLKMIKKCDVVSYNVRPPETGIEGLGELDVVGLDFPNKAVYLCEVATHLGGLEYGKGYEDSAERVRKKFERQRVYADKYLSEFAIREFSFWAPRVPQGALMNKLLAIPGLTLVVNKQYSERVDELKAVAKKTTKEIGNPAFRLLQILEHLR